MLVAAATAAFFPPVDREPEIDDANIEDFFPILFDREEKTTA
jgi:hypothetical protein